MEGIIFSIWDLGFYIVCCGLLNIFGFSQPYWKLATGVYTDSLDNNYSTSKTLEILYSRQRLYQRQITSSSCIVIKWIKYTWMCEKEKKPMWGSRCHREKYKNRVRRDGLWGILQRVVMESLSGHTGRWYLRGALPPSISESSLRLCIVIADEMDPRVEGHLLWAQR